MKGNITRFEDFNEDYEEESEENRVSKKWYEEVQDDPKTFPEVTDQILIQMKEEAKKCHDSDVANYNIKNAKTNSNYRWMKTVMAKGTVSDKLAAYTLTIQDNPICSLEQLRNLVGMVKVGKKKECVIIIQNLTELYLSDLLRPNEKLKPFHQRPLSMLNDISSGNAVTRRKYLSYWYFEDQLKEIYTLFVLALNTVAHDTLDANKEKAIGAMYQLLAGHCEQEKNLLSHIVNKLGDPSQKVASKTIYCLSQLLFKHPNMQAVVLNEIEKLIFRANVSTKAQYYALCFLSQYYLSHDTPEVARKLIEVYFSFFKACIKKGEVDSRMMSALLMGVNRAYPYAKLEVDKISEHVNTMYKVVHIANFNVSLHALQLLYQVSDYSNNVNDRFYSALYKKLCDPKMTTTTHQAMLLNLIYKALLKDTQAGRTRTFIKRLLQLAIMMQPSLACGILFLVSQILHKKENCDAFELKKLDFVDADNEDEEKYADVKEEPIDETYEVIESASNVLDINDIKEDVLESKPSWHHCKLKKGKDKNEFNPMARNPLYAGGEHCAYVELNDLIHHFHPTVSLFSSQILKGETIRYPGDPLKDFALIRFLDRFVFKNPKKVDEITKQGGAHPTFGSRKLYVARGVRSLSVNSNNYLDQEKNIPVDEMFMFSYLQKKRQEQRPVKDEEDSDVDSVCSEDFEEMLHKMGGKYKDVDDDLDYMNEIGENLKHKKKNKKGAEDDSEEEENLLSEDDEISDDESETEDNMSDDGEDDVMNDEDKELIGDLDDEDSDILFESDEEEQDTKGKKNKKIKGDIHSLFASADEFAALLEDEGNAKYAPGSSNAIANEDKAGTKQLDWEDKRNRWVRGYNDAIKNPTGKFGKKGNNFSKKRPNNKQKGGNNKKHKRF